jgi:hypothetical protein
VLVTYQTPSNATQTLLQLMAIPFDADGSQLWAAAPINPPAASRVISHSSSSDASNTGFLIAFAETGLDRIHLRSFDPDLGFPLRQFGTDLVGGGNVSLVRDGAGYALGYRSGPSDLALARFDQRLELRERPVVLTTYRGAILGGVPFRAAVSGGTYVASLMLDTNVPSPSMNDRVGLMGVMTCP